MKTPNSSLDFLHAAESDYRTVKVLYTSCKENAIGFIAEQACEKYLKHLIALEKNITDLTKIPVPKEDLHNLSRLCAYLYRECNFETPYDLREEYYKVSRLYQQVRYPGHFLYHDITNAEIELCVNTVTKCRNLVLSRIAEIEKGQENDKTPKIDAFKDEYDFLSNFYGTTVFYNGLKFNSVEAAYQAAKCVNGKDMLMFTDFTPVIAKKMGKKVALRPDWENVKLDIMKTLVRYKFNNNPLLKEKLLETGDALLEEGNYWHDTYWGVCNGVGENHLGKILMTIRDELKELEKDNEYTEEIEKEL